MHLVIQYMDVVKKEGVSCCRILEQLLFPERQRDLILEIVGQPSLEMILQPNDGRLPLLRENLGSGDGVGEDHVWGVQIILDMFKLDGLI